MKSNIVKCLVCGTILESKYRHDYKVCGCINNTMVDGGGEYLRYGGQYLDLVEVLQSADDKEEDVVRPTPTPGA